MLSSGNPQGVQKIADIAQPNVRFVNRNLGSGTRLWLDAELRKLNIPAEKIVGYDKIVKTHSEAAALIASGKADAALGLQAAAYQHRLAFLPLFEERYDLILPRENEQTLLPLLEYLQTATFRTDLNALTGYNSAHSGEQIQL
jgi:putative molybdopterin biosynthesis protein